MIVGFFWQGLPPYVIPWAINLLPQGSTSVETGTFQGDTTALLLQAFGSCSTIERSKNLADRAYLRFAAEPRVSVVQGSSRDRLAEVLPPEPTGCFFWLDAHGVYDYLGPDPEENPLLFELETIFRHRGKAANIIAIDDARGMGTQPEWPALADILKLLDDNDYAAVIVDDTLIAAPKSLHPNFYDLYRASRTVEVASLFQVWPNVVRTTQLRRVSDGLYKSVRRVIGG